MVLTGTPRQTTHGHSVSNNLRRPLLVCCKPHMDATRLNEASSILEGAAVLSSDGTDVKNLKFVPGVPRWDWVLSLAKAANRQFLSIFSFRALTVKKPREAIANRTQSQQPILQLQHKHHVLVKCAGTRDSIQTKVAMLAMQSVQEHTGTSIA